MSTCHRVGPRVSGRPRLSDRLGFGPVMALLVLVGLLVAACGQGPREVHLGQDGCDHCHMTITDDRFTAQLVTDRGRTYVFDSIECMAEFLVMGDEVPADRVGSLWVTDFPAGGSWIEAREARFLRSPELRSPMGLDLSAFADADVLDEFRRELGGEVLDWDGVMELVREVGVRRGGMDHAREGDHAH